MAGCFGGSQIDKHIENQVLGHCDTEDKCDFCDNKSEYSQDDFFGEEKYYCVDCYGELENEK